MIVEYQDINTMMMNQPMNKIVLPRTRGSKNEGSAYLNLVDFNNDITDSEFNVLYEYEDEDGQINMAKGVRKRAMI